MFKKLKIKKYKNYNSGMTLIELLVVLGIFALISGITMFDYNGFRSSVSLQNLSDDVALSIRKAQSYAIGAKSTTASTSDDAFKKGYGIHFSQNTSNEFVIFSDVSDYKKYNSNSTSDSCGIDINTSNECLEKLRINLSSGDKILGFTYGDNNTEVIAENLDITFIRPNPDATFCFYDDIGDQCKTPESTSSKVGIIISNKDEDNRKLIYVTILGKISIQNNYLPQSE